MNGCGMELFNNYILYLTLRRNSLDQYVWKCQTKTCSKYKTNLSIRTNSFLTTSKISLRTWIDVLRGLRVCINRHFNVNPVKLGGDNVVCQIDESLFCHKAYF